MGFVMNTTCLVVATLLIMSLAGDKSSAEATAVTKLMATQQHHQVHATASTAIPINEDDQPSVTHAVLKRSFSPYFSGWPSPSAGFAGSAKNPWNNGGYDGTNGNEWGAAFGNSGSSGLLDSWNGHRAHGPSPAEVANAIAMAKQASANVLIAQQQVQAAKDNVLHQQRLATEKETHASILTQKSEAAAAIQRSEAAASAQSVILAQQRLAAAKNMVAQQQRIASAKEAQAAQALHNSAHAAAAEIQRTEHEAARLASEHRSDSAAASHHLAATKDVILGPLHAGNNHVPNVPLPYHTHHSTGPAAYAAWQGSASPFATTGGGNPDWAVYTGAQNTPSSRPVYNPWG